AATHLTRPTDAATLAAFYRRVRPAGPGWAPVRAATGLGPSPDSLSQALLGWVLGCAFVYAAMFGTGSILYGKWPQASMWIVVFVVSGASLARLLPRLWAASPPLTTHDSGPTTHDP
ncbi:MAG: Na+/solute symporter, partial [Gemmatimonadetes bacterium]|nr:Na+/solute symporter [Gemmatimonadota bacterium]